MTIREKVARALHADWCRINQRCVGSKSFWDEIKDDWLRQADAALAALGLNEGGPNVIVPREPTDKMYRAGYRITRDERYGPADDATGGAVYRAMIAANPEPS